MAALYAAAAQASPGLTRGHQAEPRAFVDRDEHLGVRHLALCGRRQVLVVCALDVYARLGGHGSNQGRPSVAPHRADIAVLFRDAPGHERDGSVPLGEGPHDWTVDRVVGQVQVPSMGRFRAALALLGGIYEDETR